MAPSPLHTTPPQPHLPLPRHHHLLLLSPCFSLQIPIPTTHLFDQTPKSNGTSVSTKRTNAHHPFDETPHDKKSAASYAAEIGACVSARRWGEAVEAFASMLAAGAAPDKFLLPKVLRSFAEVGDPRLAAAAHAYVAKAPPLADVVVGNALVDMYAKCGDVASARAVFHGMRERDVVSWTALVGAYVDAGFLDEAYEVFGAMRASGVRPDVISWNALVSGFARNGDVDMALRLFDEMRMDGIQPGVNSWNGVISGCVQSACLEEAVELFREMCSYERPNAVTVASILPACSGLRMLGLGRELHSYVIRSGIALNVYIVAALVRMYTKCGKFGYAKRVFSLVEEKNVTVWNEMITACIDEGKMAEAWEAFHTMRADGLKPDTIVYNSFIAAYAKMGQEKDTVKVISDMVRAGLKPNVISLNVLISGFHHCGLHADALDLFREMQLSRDGESNNEMFLDGNNPIQPSGVTITSILSVLTDLKLPRLGKEVHCYALRNGFELNIFVLSKLVDLYGKCDDMVSAAKVFQGIKDKNIVTWNILMAGYNHNGKPEVALESFSESLEHNFRPNSVTVMIALLACGMTMALRFGRELHGYIEKNRPDGYPATLASALIDMYVKCGSIGEARLVLNNTVQKDIGVWNAMMAGYSLHRMAREAISLFKEIEQSGIRPDPITFTTLFSACKQEGFMEEAWTYFNIMEDAYGIKPALEHYTCMIDIMGTAGLLEESLEIIRKMPFEPDACLWATLLKACRLHSNHEIGGEAAEALFELEPNNASNYMILSNIFANAGLWDSAAAVRNTMMEQGLNVATQCSWLYLGTTVRVFKAGDCSHLEMEKILDAWTDLADRMRQSGYDPQDVELDNEVEDDPFSCHHTEKIAVCFGIISVHAQDPIRVSKNFRMCVDCHSSIKFISRDNNREIFVSDGCAHHHFQGGICSCGDKW